MLDSALEIYLRERLLASTWTRVAVRNGKVVGVIMGQVEGQPPLGDRLKNTALTWGHMARTGVIGASQWKSMRQNFAFNRVYSNLRSKTTAALTDELTLFAVASTTRGLGVGKTLYRDYLEHLRTLGRKDFYLYTDSLCTYEFYEKQGMSRAAAEDMTLDGRTRNIYL